MEPFADVACILKVNAHCDACKMKMMEILSSISGVYSISIDAEEGTASVSGEVDPNILLRALARSGKHAELVKIKLNHPFTNHNNGYSSSSSSSSCGYNNHGRIDDPYMHRTLPQSPAMRRYAPEYSSYASHNYYDPLPSARYVPSYPQRAYDPYEDESIGFCSIM